MSAWLKHKSTFLIMLATLGVCSVAASTPQSSRLSSTPMQATDVRLRDESGIKVLEFTHPSLGIEKWIRLGKVEILPSGTRFHHWGPEADIQHWARHGITDEEIRSAVTRLNKVDVYGGGFYVSLNPLDSSDYGNRLLIAEPQHDVTILNTYGSSVSYIADSMAIRDDETMIDVPMELIRRAGIEGVRYRPTWIVTIRGSLLENLFEASWPDFLSRYASRTSIFNVLKFASKYELTDEILRSPQFQNALPWYYRLANGLPLSKSEIKAIVSSFIHAVKSGAIFTDLYDRRHRSQVVWQNLVKATYEPMKAALARTLLAMNPTADSEKVRQSLLPLAAFFGLSRRDLDQRHLVSRGNPNSEPSGDVSHHSNSKSKGKSRLTCAAVFGGSFQGKAK